jgi:hypothetical protein
VANGVSRAADAERIGESEMALFLLLIIVAIALGIAGTVVKCLPYRAHVFTPSAVAWTPR